MAGKGDSANSANPSQPKKARRARDGLLSHRLVPSAKKPIFQRNATQSPLLRLPSEIRDRISKLALGGYHLNYSVPFNEKVQLCYVPKSIYNQNPGNSEIHWSSFVWSEHSAGPHTKLYPLALVCRQLHQETSLLPFELNLFSFESWSSLRSWLKSLKPVQIRAVKTIGSPTAFHSDSLPQIYTKYLSSSVQVLLRAWFSNDRYNCVGMNHGDTVKNVALWKNLGFEGTQLVHNNQHKCKTCRGMETAP